MQSARPAARKIDSSRSFGHIRIREERSTTEFTIGNDALRTRKIPLQSQRIYSGAIRCVGFLEHHNYRDSINGVLESPAKKTWSVLIRENPAITHSYIPQRGIRRSPVCAVAAAGPYLQLAPAFLRALLRMRMSWGEKNEQGENTRTFGQRKISWATRYSVNRTISDVSRTYNGNMSLKTRSGEITACGWSKNQRRRRARSSRLLHIPFEREFGGLTEDGHRLRSACHMKPAKHEKSYNENQKI
jgi:hypothetical protein